MRGRKPDLKVVSGPQDSRLRAPSWLPKEAKAEWSVATADLASRGLLFRGALATLASYCLCIAAIRQRQAVLDTDPTDRATFQDQMKAVAQANRLAVELGLTVTSRTRAFQGKSADERDWGDLGVA
jgi:P27 family predicted phage terminase small subunit